MRDSAKPILVVEDDRDDQLLIRRAFAKSGVINPIQMVSDGDAAVQRLGEGDEGRPLPVMVLLDLKLPRRSGLEVLEWLRASPPPLGRLPVVVLTSSRESSDLERAYELGANSYLVKPVDFAGLLDMLRATGHYWTMLNETPPP